MFLLASAGTNVIKFSCIGFDFISWLPDNFYLLVKYSIVPLSFATRKRAIAVVF